MLRDILENEKIEYFAAIPYSLCRAGNLRLYEQIPSDTYALFMLFPYYVKDTDPTLSKFSAVYDYHGFAAAVFEKCEKYLENKYPGRYFKGFTDHSPFSEGEGACRAGLGIKGLNGLLINEKYSSFVCIGEMVCELSREELEPEGIPLGNGELKLCEECGACERACPAGCCGKDTREGCISALTQKKKDLSQSEREAIRKSGYLWGCDVCASVCPHMKFTETPIEYFHKGAIRENAAGVIARMDEETYKKYPFSWRKREIIMRNCEILREEKHNG